MSDPELGPANRRAKRRRTLVPGACRCGEADPVALRELNGAAICAHCLAVAQGRSPIERHHVLERANDRATAAMDVNEHDRFSDRQRDWPTDTLRNLRRSAHRRRAAMLRAAIDPTASSSRCSSMRQSDWRRWTRPVSPTTILPDGGKGVDRHCRADRGPRLPAAGQDVEWQAVAARSGSR